MAERLARSGASLPFAYDRAAVRVVVSAREDSLAELEGLVSAIPSLALNRYRLTEMRGDQALAPVLEPARARNLVDREVAERIVRFAGEARSGEDGEKRERAQKEAASAPVTPAPLDHIRVEPAILSLVCKELNDRRCARGDRMISADLLTESASRILPDFYQRTIRGVPRVLRDFVEEELVTRAGKRSLAPEEHALDLPGVKPQHVAALVDRRLIRRDERFGEPHLELIHDVLTPAVAAARSKRRWGRRIVVGGGTLVLISVLAVGTSLAVATWQRERREQAEAQSARANALVDLVLFELRDKLAPIGRLDLLGAAAEAARDYFEKIPASGETPEQSRRRAVALSNLGDVFVAQGKLSDARDTYQRHLDIAQRLATSDPFKTAWQRDLSISLKKIGGVLVAQGKLSEARDTYQRGLDIAQRLATSDPSNTQWQRDLSVGFNKVGNVLVAQGKLSEARDTYQRSLDIRQHLATLDPSNTAWQRDLSVSFNMVGAVLFAQGKLDEARDTYQRSLDIAQRLATSDPSNTQWQRDLSVGFNKVGNVLVAQGKLSEARDTYQRSLDIRQHLATLDPSNTAWQRDLSVSFNMVGAVLFAQGKLDEARDTYQRSLDIRQRLATSDPSNTEWQRDAAVTQMRLAALEAKAEHVSNAIALLEAARATSARLAAQDPSNATWHNDLRWIDNQLAEWKQPPRVPKPESRRP